MQGAPAFSPLTRRLYPDSADLELRRELARDSSLLNGLLVERMTQAAGWEKLREFLLQCVNQRIPTLVYGDYDVDGSVSSTLMFRWLRANGVPANIFLPSRFHHGYGLDRGIIEQMAGQGYRRLLALDCGTANLEEIAVACEHGLEVAVVDHHTCKDQLPKACMLNPHIDKVLPALCTAGLAYAVLVTLASEAVGVAPAPPPPPWGGPKLRYPFRVAPARPLQGTACLATNSNLPASPRSPMFCHSSLSTGRSAIMPWRGCRRPRTPACRSC